MGDDQNKVTKSKPKGFERAFKLVGGHGRFQWLCVAICSVQLIMMTWNHMSYIFMGAVPQHWCSVEDYFSSTNWTVDQMKNISIPKRILRENENDQAATTVKYEQCSYFDLNYELLLVESDGNFEFAYDLVHGPSSKDSGDDNGVSNYQTNKLKPCEKWSYDQSIYRSTIATEFDLVCGRRYLVASIQALYMIGAFTGTLVFGPINDKILGRRKTALFSIVLVLVGGFLASLSVSYVMFVLMRFLVAMGTAGCMQAFSVWFLEHCDTKSRAKFYCISSIFFGTGYAIMSLYAYYIRDWSNLQLAFSITTLSLVSFFWILPESPRWLASNGQEEEAVKALLRIAKINGKNPNRDELMKIVKSCYHSEGCHDDELDQEIPLNDVESNGIQNGDKVANGLSAQKRTRNANNGNRGGFWSILFHKVILSIKNFRSLLSTSELRRISFTVWGLFVSVAFIYYGFAFSSSNILGTGSGPYLLVALGAVMEIPASVLPIPFLSRWGRRPSIIVCYVLTGISSLLIAMTPQDYEVARTVLSMIGKLFVASAFTILYLVVSEVYPTVVRSTGQGAGTLTGRIGSIAAPFVADLLTTVYPDLPSIIFGIVALAASLIAMLLPEMKDVDMKDQLT